jgi:4-carboxymuconolactone decarboxylase
MASKRAKPRSLKPRLPVLSNEDLTTRGRAIVKEWPYNLHRIIANSPGTLDAWMTFAVHILRENSLPEWDREIAVLRVAWNCRSHYEWGLHERLARRLGFQDIHFDGIVEGPDAEIWKTNEAALINAVDDMQRDWEISAASWTTLAKTYSSQQLVDLVFLVGEFILVALTLKSFRIPQESDVSGLPMPSRSFR